MIVSENHQKQPPRSVPWKSCSENMQHIYRRTPMPKYNFNNVAKQLYWNRTLAWVFSCKLAIYFQNTFSQEHLWVAVSAVLNLILSQKVVSQRFKFSCNLHLSLYLPSIFCYSFSLICSPLPVKCFPSLFSFIILPSITK